MFKPVFTTTQYHARVFISLTPLSPKLRPIAYQTLLDKGFTSAFFMIERALEAVGEPGTQGTLWTFPDAETKDMAARIFGDSTTKPKNPKDRVWTISERMTLIKSIFSCTTHLGTLILTGP